MTSSPATKLPSRLRRAAVAVTAASGALLSIAGTAPAEAAPQTTRAYVWATDVNMRSCPSFSCPPYGRVKVSTMYVDAYCQNRGDLVQSSGYRNDWWVQVDAGGPRGWISAVFVRGGSDMSPIPGVSQDFGDCF
jgi:hypothetical protein